MFCKYSKLNLQIYYTLIRLYFIWKLYPIFEKNIIMKKTVYSLIAILFYASNSFCQIKQVNKNICFFNDGNKNVAEEICPKAQFKGFKDDDGIEKLVKNITAQIGLKPNFILIPCNNINNAYAVLYDDNIRYIVYDKPFLDGISKNVKTNWSNMMILAHEVGHHLNGHTLTHSNKETTRNEELEADEFAGFILGKMGATEIESAAAMNGIPHPDCDVEYFSDHPCKVKRVNAIKVGWAKATGKKYELTAKQKAAQQKIIPVNKSILKGRWYTELDNERGVDGFMPLTITFINDTTIHYKFYTAKADSILEEYDSYYSLEKGILIEGLPYNGNFKAKAKVQMLSKRAFLLTIIDNGLEGYKGLKRVYVRIKDEE